MPTVEDRRCTALAIWRDSLAASAGWTDDVQMPGVARAGMEAGVRAGLGVRAVFGIATGPETLAGVGARATRGVPASPGTSTAVSTHTSASNWLHRRIVITLLGSADDNQRN